MSNATGRAHRAPPRHAGRAPRSPVRRGRPRSGRRGAPRPGRGDDGRRRRPRRRADGPRRHGGRRRHVPQPAGGRHAPPLSSPRPTSSPRDDRVRYARRRRVSTGAGGPWCGRRGSPTRAGGSSPSPSRPRWCSCGDRAGRRPGRRPLERARRCGGRGDALRDLRHRSGDARRLPLRPRLPVPAADRSRPAQTWPPRRRWSPVVARWVSCSSRCSSSSSTCRSRTRRRRAGLLALSTLPLLTMVVAAVLGVEPLTARKTAGVLIAMGGVGVALTAASPTHRPAPGVATSSWSAGRCAWRSTACGPGRSSGGRDHSPSRRSDGRRGGRPHCPRLADGRLHGRGRIRSAAVGGRSRTWASSAPR